MLGYSLLLANSLKTKYVRKECLIAQIHNFFSLPFSPFVLLYDICYFFPKLFWVVNLA